MDKTIQNLLDCINVVSNEKSTNAAQYIKDLSIAVLNLKNADK